jgi:two-component system, NtrC family, sensor kinase
MLKAVECRDQGDDGTNEVEEMKILVVDDDKIHKAILEKVLKSKGFEVVMVDNGRKAWDYFQANRASIVITDWMMPEMDGMELCRLIRSADAGYYTYIIVLSGKDSKEDQVKMLQGGADDFILKPFNPKELLARIATGERVIRLENQHVKLESMISESRNKFRTLFDALREEIIAIDRNMHIVSANFSFVNAYSLDYENLFGQPYSSIAGLLTDTEGRDVGTAIVQTCFAEGERSMQEVASKDARGRHCVRQLSALPVKGKEGETLQVVLISRDITEERDKSRRINELNQKLTQAVKQINQKNITLENTLQQLKESQLRVLQSEKMASIGQLAAGVAHEINNPTGYVSSNLKTLSDYQQSLQKAIGLYRQMVERVKEQMPGEAVSRLLAEIASVEESEDIGYVLEDMAPLISESMEGTQRIKKIVNDLKAFSHPGEDAKKPSDINENINSTLNIVWNEIKYKATVEKDLGEIPLVECYPQRINQVIMNILVNAAHAIEAEGVIRIRTRRVGDQIEIVISDNGCGISEENLPKIFDPFFTTKAVGKGTGLGLNLAYNIISDHGGTIDVGSKVGEGTSFTIRLPVHPETPAMESQTANG